MKWSYALRTMFAVRPSPPTAPSMRKSWLVCPPLNVTVPTVTSRNTAGPLEICMLTVLPPLIVTALSSSDHT